MGELYERSRKWHRHTYRCRHRRVWGASCDARCTVCGSPHIEPETVTLPGEITPYVDWYPAPDDDRGEYRSRFVWPEGEVLDIEVIAPRRRTVGGGNPAPNDSQWCDERIARRTLPTTGYRTVTLEPEDLARLRLEWRVEWFRPDDGEIVQSEDGYTLVVHRLEADDDQPEVIDSFPMLRVREKVRYSLATLRQWRRAYRQ